MRILSRKFKYLYSLSVHFVNVWQSAPYYFPILGLRKLRLWAKETPTFLPPFSEKPATFLRVYRTAHTTVKLFHIQPIPSGYMVTAVTVTVIIGNVTGGRFFCYTLFQSSLFTNLKSLSLGRTFSGTAMETRVPCWASVMGPLSSWISSAVT